MVIVRSRLIPLNVALAIPAPTGFELILRDFQVLYSQVHYFLLKDTNPVNSRAHGKPTCNHADQQRTND